MSRVVVDGSRKMKVQNIVNNEEPEVRFAFASQKIQPMKRRAVWVSIIF
jgi:hypothetical protein